MSIQNTDLIEKYINNLLTEEEKLAVEKRLQEDPEFADEYRHFKQLILGLRYTKLIEKQAMLQEYDATLNSAEIKTEKGKLITLGRIAIAAGLVLFLAWIGFNTLYEKDNKQTDNIVLDKNAAKQDTGNLKDNKTTPEPDTTDNASLVQVEDKTIPDEIDIAQILNPWYKSSFAMNTLRSEDNGNTPYNQAVKLYNEKRYSRTIELLGKTENPSENYLQAHAYFNMGMYKKSASLFGILADDEYFENAKDANWYLFLSQIALGKEYEKQAQNTGSKLLKDDTYRNQVIKIYKKLNWKY